MHGQFPNYKRRLQRLQELTGGKGGVLLVYAGQQHSKLIATKPGDGVGFPQRALEAESDLLQQQVASVMAYRIVDFLEVIQVHEY